MSRVPAPDVSIRRGRAADAGGILALEAAFPSDRMSARSVRRFLGVPSARVLIADRAGEVAGALILLLRRNSHWARIYSVAVDPRYRGCGLGRRLVEAAHGLARRERRQGVSLEVRADNVAALGLYRGLGYVEAARLPAYYEDGAPGIRLRKPFGRPRRTRR
ncbi:N-acetyltransferase [Fontimonas sp. SYSU GA230001]|uniref:GNAT family N-acetyltransferase n=1 Tax=Fontimonas sp. SYSU GA230001 TaxID=3142450 RepID=UPI0032B31B3E